MANFGCFTADLHTNMGRHQLYNNGLLVQFSASWLGCTIEKNLDYLWNDLNDGLEDKQPDVISCRSFCKSTMSAKYFSWTGPDYPNPEDREGCWCKSALEAANQKVVNGVFSGETVCDEDNNGE